MADFGDRDETIEIKSKRKEIEMDSHRLRIKQIELRQIELDFEKKTLAREIEQRKENIKSLEREILELKGGE